MPQSQEHGMKHGGPLRSYGMVYHLGIYPRFDIPLFIDEIYLSALSCDSDRDGRMTAIGQTSLSLCFPSNKALFFPFLYTDICQVHSDQIQALFISN